MSRDLKIEHCLRAWANLRAPKPDDFKTADLRPVAESHERNVRRVWQLTAFPPVTVHAVRIIEQITYEKRFELRQEILTGQISNQEFADRVKAALDANADERDAIIKGGGKAAQEMLQKDVAEGAEVLNSMLSTNLQEGGQAWMSSIVTGSWTAFEALAEDVWQTALNVRPRGLAELVGAKSARAKGDESKSVPLGLLQKYGYDLSSKMGTILKERYSFDRLEDIRRAYAEASFENDAKIAEAITDKKLDALSLVRNVIVHSGGIMDAQYLRRKPDLPTAAVGNVGDPLVLDGQLVATLISPGMQRGWDLLSAVDEWLSSRSTS